MHSFSGHGVSARCPDGSGGQPVGTFGHGKGVFAPRTRLRGGAEDLLHGGEVKGGEHERVVGDPPDVFGADDLAAPEGRRAVGVPRIQSMRCSGRAVAAYRLRSANAATSGRERSATRAPSRPGPWRGPSPGMLLGRRPVCAHRRTEDRGLAVGPSHLVITDRFPSRLRHQRFPQAEGLVRRAGTP